MIVLVGGHSRKAGKTSLAAALIRSIPDADWTAVKMTAHRHAAERADPVAVHEERAASGSGDTVRYLVSGARRAFLIEVAQGAWEQAVSTLRSLAGSANCIVESNTLAQYLRADLCLMVLGEPSAEVKASARALFDAADAFVLTAEVKGPDARPHFRVHPPEYASPELVNFVRSRLGL